MQNKSKQPTQQQITASLQQRINIQNKQLVKHDYQFKYTKQEQLQQQLNTKNIQYLALKQNMLARIEQIYKQQNNNRNKFLISQSQLFIQDLDLMLFKSLFQDRNTIQAYLNIFKDNQKLPIPENLDIHLQQVYARIHKIRYINGDFTQPETMTQEYLTKLMTYMHNQLTIPLQSIQMQGQHLDVYNIQNGACQTTRIDNGKSYNINPKHQFNAIMYINSENKIKAQIPPNIYGFTLISRVFLSYCPLRNQNFNLITSLSLSRCVCVPLEQCKNLKFLKLSYVTNVNMQELGKLRKLQSLYLKYINTTGDNFIVDYVLDASKNWPQLRLLHLLKCASSNNISISQSLPALEDLWINSSDGNYKLTINLNQNQISNLQCLCINGSLVGKTFLTKILFSKYKQFYDLDSQIIEKDEYKIVATKLIDVQQKQKQNYELQNNMKEIYIQSEKIQKKNDSKKVIQLQYAPIEKYVITQYRKQQSMNQYSSEDIEKILPQYIYFTDIQDNWQLKHTVSEFTKSCMLSQIRFEKTNIQYILSCLFQAMETQLLTLKGILIQQSMTCTKNFSTKKIDVYKHPISFIQQLYIACMMNDFKNNYTDEQQQIAYDNYTVYDVAIFVIQDTGRITLPQNIRNLYYYGNFETINWTRFSENNIISISIQCAKCPSLQLYINLKQLSLVNVYNLDIQQISQMQILKNVQLINVEFNQTIQIENHIQYNVEAKTKIQQEHGKVLLQNLLNMPCLEYLIVNIPVSKQVYITQLSKSLRIIRIHCKSLEQLHLDVNLKQFQQGAEQRVLDVLQSQLYVRHNVETYQYRAKKIIIKQ